MTPVDFRPISILPTISKVHEKIVRKQIEHHLQNFSILNKDQSGFRPGKSTGTALLSVIEEARDAMDNGKITVLVLDFSKAFDSVDHDILYHPSYSREASNHGYLASRKMSMRGRLTPRSFTLRFIVLYPLFIASHDTMLKTFSSLLLKQHFTREVTSLDLNSFGTQCPCFWIIPKAFK